MYYFWRLCLYNSAMISVTVSKSAIEAYALRAFEGVNESDIWQIWYWSDIWQIYLFITSIALYLHL